MNNKVLMDAEAKVESALLPETRAAYLKIVVAGMKVGVADGETSILAGLAKKSQNPLKDAAVGALNLVLLMRSQARGTMPIQAMIPAAMTLMLNGLDFVDKAGIMKIGAPQLAEATHYFTNHALAAFKISPTMLGKMGAQVNQVMRDPTAMEKISRRAGLVKVANASTPSGIINNPALMEAKGETA